MPCAQSARDRPAGAPAPPPAGAATDPSRGCGWRGSGTGAPRRASMPRWCSCTCACVQASVAARSNVGRIAILVGEVERLRRATARRASRKRRARVSPGGSAHAAPQAHDRIEHRAGGVGQRPAVDHRRRRRGSRARGRGTARGRSPTAARRPSRPRRPTTWASQTGGSPRDRGRRVASSVSSSGTHSVWTNRLENAGWAASAAGGASTTSAYEVSSISRVARPEVRERDAAHLGVVLRRDDHLERGRRSRRRGGRSRPDPRRT